jgi:Fic family protein
MMSVEPKGPKMNSTDDMDDTIRRMGKTLGVTQRLQGDIIEFLSSKHTRDATVTVAEIMKLYDCPDDRARRVIKALVEDEVLKPAGQDVYKVII